MKDPRLERRVAAQFFARALIEEYLQAYLADNTVYGDTIGHYLIRDDTIYRRNLAVKIAWLLTKWQ